MRIISMFVLFTMFSLSFSAPVPRTKEKKKETDFSMVGEWSLQWGHCQANVIFDTNKTYRWSGTDSTGIWEGTWEMEDGVLIIRERRLDENREYWYISRTKLDGEGKGFATIADDPPYKIPVHYVRRKADF